MGFLIFFFGHSLKAVTVGEAGGEVNVWRQTAAAPSAAGRKGASV